MNKYIVHSAKPIHKNYDNYKKYPNHLFNHLDGVINDGNKFVSDDLNYINIKRPKKAIGCMLQRYTINKFSLGPITKKVINTFKIYRIKQFKKYIINAQNAGAFNKNIDPIYYSKYIYAQFSLVQILRLNTTPKDEIKNIINIALKPLIKS